jgi:molybdate transport system substrate-binding protein
MGYLDERKLIDPASHADRLGNTLVLIEPADGPATDLSIAPGFALAEKLGDGRLATGNPQSVPVGRYAKAALTTFGVWDAIAPRIAGVDNVRAALALVARGEARFGIVYVTDAKTEPKVRVVGAFPPSSHPPIVYPFALTAGAVNPDARAFLAYLSTAAALKVFQAEGFTVLK